MYIDYLKVMEVLKDLEIVFNYDNLSISVDFVNISPFPNGEGFDFHTHSNYEFHYIKRGKGIVIMNDIEYQLDGNSFYLTGPGVIHKQVADINEPMLEYALKCDIKHIGVPSGESKINSSSEYEYIINILDKRANRVVQDNFGIEGLFEKIFEEIFLKRPGYFTEIKTAIFNIIIATARNFAPETGVDYQIPRRDMNSHRLRLIKSYIADNYNKNITCNELSGHLFLSNRQLNRIIQSETGYSVHDFVISEKIRIVCELLRSTKQKLRDIADQTGFSSEYHLSNAFKKWTGMSPVKFREINSKAQ